MRCVLDYTMFNRAYSVVMTGSKFKIRIALTSYLTPVVTPSAFQLNNLGPCCPNSSSELICIHIKNVALWYIRIIHSVARFLLIIVCLVVV
jgi:hypothetical protein